MIKTLKNKKLICGLIICLVVCLAIGIFSLPSVNAYAETEPVTGNYDKDFVVTDTANEVLAEYSFSVLNETECSVRITNKTTATKALIPDVAEIDGKDYKVAEIAVNGFLSATKLVRVKLPSSIQKIGNMAFANCTSLKRIVMANVVEIGNNAFYRCTSLENLVLPRSVEIVGSTILRSNNTAVHIRAESVGDNWAENWNTGNGITEIDMNSTYIEPLELETIYRTVARTSEPQMVGYAVAEGQPRTDKYYEEEGTNIFLPNMYNNDYLLAINNGAFADAVCEKLVIEYSAKTLFVGSNTFEGLICDDIIINRNVTFLDESTGVTSDNVFAFSTVKRIVLPDTISELPVAAFTYCTDLTNIFFATPQYEEKRDVVLQFVDDLAENSQVGIVNLTQSEAFATIRESAFMGTTSITELHIYDNVKTIESDICADWTDSQHVYVHNANRNMSQANGYNIHPQWHNTVSATNVHYDAKYYTITFHFDDGTNNTLTKDVKFGEPIGEMPTNDYAYHNLYAWADDIKQWTEDTIYDIDGDWNLHASYSSYSYTITYNPNSPNPNLYPVYGDMSPSAFAFNDYSPLPTLGYSINGWDFVEWRITYDDVTLNFNDQQVINVLEILQTFNLPTYDGYGITLHAIWTLHEYTIEFVYDRGDNPSTNPTTYTIQSDTIVFDNIQLEGYTCWWNPESIPQGSYGNITVTAHYFETDLYKVSYDLNGGTNAQNPIEFKFDEDNYLNNPTRTNYSFVGWKLQGTANTFVTNLKGFEEDITLEAIWVETGTIYPLSTSATSITVSASKSTIALPDYHNYFEIIVDASVQQLYLYRQSLGTNLISIKILGGRTTEFSLILNNVRLRSNNALYPTINMQDSNTLNITAYKECIIEGAIGERGAYGTSWGSGLELGENGKEGGLGGIAIKCQTVKFCSPITIIGGTGGMGGNGSSGKYGYDGGKGGDGNYAIVANIIIIGASNISVCGGNGGGGGHGGGGYTPYNCGKGAWGGFGCVATAMADGSGAPQIIGQTDYADVTFSYGQAGIKGVNGDKIHVEYA